MKLLHVVITDKFAIYINDTRVTNRNTKWGVHHTVFEFRCKITNLEKYLAKHKENHNLRFAPLEPNWRELIK